MSVQQEMSGLSDCYRLASTRCTPSSAASFVPVRTPTTFTSRPAHALCEQFDRYDPSKPFIAWACGVAWRSVLLHRTNASRLRLLTHEELGSVLADKFAASAAQVDPRLERLRECLAALKPESREIIERHYFEDEEIGRVADRLGVSESCVYKTLARIRRTLLDCVERKLKEDR